MAWSKLTVVIVTISPFVFWITAITAFWEIYQFEMSLSKFSGIFNTIYFFITSIYFMVWFLILWEESLVEGSQKITDKKCKDCEYATEMEIALKDIWCDLDKANYPTGSQACHRFEERKKINNGTKEGHKEMLK